MLDNSDDDYNQFIVNLILYFTYNFEFDCYILFWVFIFFNKKMRIQSYIYIIYYIN
jgi:hypothetical protein